MVTPRDLFVELLNNLEEEINIIIEKGETEGEWTKDLTGMPVFTIKEIEKHRIKSGKQGKVIIKTMERGRKFMEENYLLMDSIFVKISQRSFIFKACCKASMKKEIEK